MKKRMLSLFFMLCMMISMVTSTVSAGSDGAGIYVQFESALLTMEVGDSIQLQYTVKNSSKVPAFRVGSSKICSVNNKGVLTALKAGRTEVKATINGKNAGKCVVVVKETGGKSSDGKKNTWPFVPSTKNTTNGKIKSGWYLIYTHDRGMLRASESGRVTPTREVQKPYYIEHLGNEKYYVYDVSGRFLSHEGKASESSGIIMSKTPYKWKVITNYDWQYKYRFCASENSDFAISSYGTCDETEDSFLSLTYNWDSSPNLYFTLTTVLQQEVIPQWYKDFIAGKKAPTTSTEPEKEFGDVPDGLKNTNKEEWDVLKYTNIARAKEGLPLLVTFDSLQKAAGTRGDELVESYDHTRPNGSSPFTVLKENGISFTTGAENIAKGSGSPQSVMAAWMKSSGHEKNILNSKLRYLGTGFTSASNTTHWAQLFATTKDSECTSITYVEGQGYFVLKLKNGITAYAPYDPESSPDNGNGVTFRYPGVDQIKVTK